jgi:hypothetical protein
MSIVKVSLLLVREKVPPGSLLLLLPVRTACQAQ